MNSNQGFEDYKKAKKQVNEIKGFYSHFGFYIIFNAIIITVNLVYSPKDLWFIWTTLGWGIGVFFHAVKVFNWFHFFDENWEIKKIQQFMDEEKNNPKKYE